MSQINYIVIHYTGNVGDTAKNNVTYFQNSITYTSAHYFVSDKTIYQSVPDDYIAYSVGLGSRTEPYFKYPVMWKKITNTNSISIELCGSSNSLEASDKTKETAAELVSTLLKEYNLSPNCVFRHYDVTGKSCPAWAVKDTTKWLQFKMLVCKYFYGEGEDKMLNNDENYSVFKSFMDRYKAEVNQMEATQIWEETAMAKAKEQGLMDGTRPKSNVTRAELATVLSRLNEK